MKKLMVLFALVLAACSSKYKTDSFDAPPQPLSLTGTAYVMMARDGNYGRRIYRGSGKIVSQQLYSAVSTHLKAALLSSQLENREQALTAARSKGISYVFEASILNWEDRATQWSGRPDRITIKIDVWNAATGKNLASSLEQASSKWFTFGGDHPQDLVPRMMKTFSDRLFREQRNSL